MAFGSAPIESAHRNVIQQRLKLAEQRWTKSGAQYIANLRMCRKSKRWVQKIKLPKPNKNSRMKNAICHAAVQESEKYTISNQWN